MLRRNVLYTCLIIALLSLPFIFDYFEKKNRNKADEIEFWQYWSGPEKKPLENLINRFNSENHGFKNQTSKHIFTTKKGTNVNNSRGST